MKKNDPTYLAALEKAIKEKYGSNTIKDFRSSWEEEKEKQYLEQLQSDRLQRDEKTKCREEINLGEIKISRRRNLKKDDRTCPVCKLSTMKTSGNQVGDHQKSRFKAL